MSKQLMRADLQEIETSHDVAMVSSLADWNDLIAERFGAIHVDAKTGSTFSANLRCTSIGDVAFYECSTSPACVSHEAAPLKPGQAAAFLIKAQIEGQSRLTCGGRVVELFPGDYVICNNREAYTLDFDCDTTIVSIPLSADNLHAITPFPERLSFIKAVPENPIRNVAYDYLESLLRNCVTGLPSQSLNRLASMFLELAVLSISQQASNDVQTEQLRSSVGLFDRCRDYIEVAFRDENTTAKCIAERMGVSLRSIQSAFAAQGWTLTNYISQRRLNEARKLLSSAGYAGQQVSEIAYAVGYKSHSHFCRAFKAAFGETPNAARSVLHH